ncbi:glyoxylase-like metal-dependent hydrolase (beta-lactamase superfamily II) [Bacillus ectoiniformans]|uniref:MBL fold metallo-hydrolase n=1 Tax=Bacillus ectoiniformans TaxID=1494429 RepID=UPI00195B71CF|nr:MBL fold metallo-hydrolase [Bacillus ectoiniformans]MBM7648088.1 glyoxylase-like metal-dependent hydrolase (beta-lactamase superfamily II) [Bacillus ectoiniformans]
MNAERFGDIMKISLPTPFPVGDVNVYVIKGDRLTLIDAGVKTKESWEAFVHGLSQFGLTPEDIEQVALTHHHPDHVGMLDFLPDDIDVIGHRYNEKFLTRDEHFMKEQSQFFERLFRQFGLPKEWEPMLKQMGAPLKFSCEEGRLTKRVKEGDELPGLNGWSVYETPGHAQSHLVFFREKDGTLFAGDHVLATISSNPLLEPPLRFDMERPKPQVQYNESLKKMLHLPIEKAFTGHGGEVTRIHSLVERRLERQHDRAMSVKEMLKDKPLTALEVCINLFPAIYKKELGLTLSETVGQLDYLLDLGQISVRTDEHQVLHYVSE